jgi:LysM repeat protein
MKSIARCIAVVILAALVATLATGCTLAGADAAPLITVVPQPTTAIPTPTEMAPIDVFGTQTAMAPTPEPVEQIVTPTPEVEPTAVPSGEGRPSTYTVQEGDNLFRIALRFGLTTQELAAANGITNVDVLSVGTVLTIPGGGDGAGGEPAGGETEYVVQAGDTLFRIATRYGLTVDELASYNGITNPDALSIGQVIRIPQN